MAIGTLMPRRFIDTNVLLRHITDDNPVQSPLAAEVLDQIADGQIEGILSITVIFETVFTLQGLYKFEREMIAPAIRVIVGAPGLHLIDASEELVSRTLDLYTSIRKLSFADCYHAVLSQSFCNGEIYTFDKEFDRIPELTRLEPGE